MSECHKVHTDKQRSLDLQLKQIIDTVTGKSSKNLVVSDPTTGLRYELTVQIVGGEPVAKFALVP